MARRRIDTSFAIEGARVHDGRRFLGTATVVVEGGLIASVGDPAPASCKVVNAFGCTLLPALIDAHTHLTEGSLAQALRFGVGTEIDMFNDPAFIAAERATALTRCDKADLLSATIGATVPGGHPIPLMVATGQTATFPTIESPHDADGFVGRVVDGGGDFLKIFIEPGESFGLRLPSVDGTVAAALIVAAHARDLLAVAHVTSWASARLAIEAGIDGLAHMPIDGVIDETLLAECRARGVFVISTLAMLEGLCGIQESRVLAEDSRVSARLSEEDRLRLSADWPVSGPRPEQFHRAMQTLRRLHAAGVGVLAGTDAINPGTAHGFSMHREVALLTRAGLSISEALAAATSVPATTFGLHDRGVLEPGRRADLLLIDGDSDDDLMDLGTLDIVAIWRGGESLDGDHDRRTPGVTP